MSNPFKNFVPDPSKVPDPKNISISQFEKYHSRDMEKMNQNLRVLKRSSKYMAGCIGVLLFLKWSVDGATKDYVLGSDSNFFLRLRSGWQISQSYYSI